MKYIPNQFKVRGLTSDFWFIRVNAGDPISPGPGLIVFLGKAPSEIEGEPSFTFAVATGHLEHAWTLFPLVLAKFGLQWTIGIMRVDERDQLDQWSADLQAGIALHQNAA